MNQRMYNVCRNVGLGIALAGATLSVSAETLQISGFPGTIGQNVRKAFIDTYDKNVEVKYVESWDSARFTQMQANRARPRRWYMFTNRSQVFSSGAVQRATAAPVTGSG